MTLGVIRFFEKNLYFRKLDSRNIVNSLVCRLARHQSVGQRPRSQRSCKLGSDWSSLRHKSSLYTNIHCVLYNYDLEKIPRNHLTMILNAIRRNLHRYIRIAIQSSDTFSTSQFRIYYEVNDIRIPRRCSNDVIGIPYMT